MGLLNDFENAISVNTDNGQPNFGPEDFKKNGFMVAAVPGADGNGLPAQKVKAWRQGKSTRQLAHWFVPEVGVIPMFINPQSIIYNSTKAIQSERTKGGFIVQYWGENLTELNIQGHTGSSGIEGLNVLYEIYRAEQYMFDSVALQMAADSSISGIADIVDSAVGKIGGLTGSLLGGAADVLGLGSGASILPKDIPSLATMATGIEFYYAGWVYRGFFTSFNMTESVDHLGLFRYDIRFMVTQRRGYRLNQFAWQHSATGKPFDDRGSAHDTPMSFDNPSNKVQRR